ncbi:T-complex protein 1 subunit delta [Morone saxatilis]|uniref:T-complex protein 1 subunit delta n=1 Tax=Morone saxatilis TaxID=34816 RepID=UPI0015E23290|nr:T-complex protein 1 subunit delta [Morone saxatilis]
MPEAKAAPRASMGRHNGGAYVDRDKPAQIRYSNISAAKAVADAVRTSLGPKGMDKMIQDEKGDVTITNDGATILKQMQVLHPAAKMLVELSKAQDIEAGDGTTSVVVIAGALLEACYRLLQKGIHPTIISESFQKAVEKGVEVLTGMSRPVQLSDRETLLNSATTSLCSKVVSQYSSLLAPMSVDAVMRVIDPATATGVDLHDIKIIKKLGGTIDDCELVEGLVLTQRVANSSVTRVEKAKIGLIQFCLSPPKTDVSHLTNISTEERLQPLHGTPDRVLRFMLRMDRQFCEGRSALTSSTMGETDKEGRAANVLPHSRIHPRCLLSDLALHFLNKNEIMVVKDDPEDEASEFICKADHGLPPAPGKTVCIVGSGLQQAALHLSSRALHLSDALCCHPPFAHGQEEVAVIPARRLFHQTFTQGVPSYRNRALIAVWAARSRDRSLPFAVWAEYSRHSGGHGGTSGNKHAAGRQMCRINVRKGGISNILEELVVQPLLVSISALTLATETVRSILKIDDVVNTR